MLEIFGAFFIGFGFPAFIFGLALINYVEIIGGIALFLIGFYLLLAAKQRKKTIP